MVALVYSSTEIKLKAFGKNLGASVHKTNET